MSLAKKVRRYRAWIAIALLAVVGGIAYYLWSSPQETVETTTYETEAATVSTISSTVSGTGNLDVHDATDVYPVVSGTVISIEIAEGDLVKAGAVLFTVDDSEAVANSAKAWSSVEQSKQGVTQASQSVVQAESSLLKAENALDDLEERSESPSSTVSDSEIEQAEKDIEAAEAQLAAAHAQQDSADASLYSASISYDNAKEVEGDYVVTSPADGVVWSLSIEEGDAVSNSGGASTGGTGDTASASSSEPPVVIAPSEPLAVLLAVNEVDAPSLAVDQRAEIEFDAIPDLALTGEVIDIAAEGTNEQGVVTYDVWISLDVSDERLLPGMSAAATIITEVAKDQLTVPNSAVQTDSDDQSYVSVLDDPDGEPRTVYVTTGISSSTYTVILEGLAEGDMVVTQTTTEGGEDEEESGGGLVMPGMGGGPPR
jgi:HlyD family secretion protein